MLNEGRSAPKSLQGKETEKTKYEMYYNFEETVPKIPSHRMLAIRRGTREGRSDVPIDVENDKFMASCSAGHSGRQSQFAPFWKARRAMRMNGCLAVDPEMKSGRFCENGPKSEAIKVFEENLRTLLLAPPAGPIGRYGH